MFQRKISEKRENLSEIRRFGKEENYVMEPSDSHEVRVVQWVKLLPEQVDQMFQGVIRNINYREIAIYCIENYIKSSDYLPIFRGLLIEKIDRKVLTFSHGTEIQTNSQMLYEKLEKYMDDNWKEILENMQTEVNTVRFAAKSVEQEEEGEALFTIIYHTEALQVFCEADPQIMGTIENLRHHYHGTPQAQKIDGVSVLHQHVTGGTALAFYKNGIDTIEIMAFGIKKDSTIKGSGGYYWDTKPK